MTLKSTPAVEADDLYAPIPIDCLYDLHRILRMRRGPYVPLKKALHESIRRAFEISRPVDWHLLTLEWPHRSLDGRVAYTRDDRAMEAARFTVTTSGKYLRRHFPGLSDHQIRDIVSLEKATGCRIVTTLEDIINAARSGPHSCMSQVNCTHTEHPYRVYLPEYGWSMAIREDDGRIDGRALIHTKDGKSIFVRSYRRCEGYSETDHTLEAWLKTQRIDKASAWAHGTKLDLCEADHSGGILMPYLDGGTQGISLKSGYVIIDKDSHLHADNSDGVIDPDGGGDDSDYLWCSDCDERDVEEDGAYIGRHRSTWVCSSCKEDYSWVYGERRREYLVYDDNVVFVGGARYDAEYLSDNDIVELSDESEAGEPYGHLDHCFEWGDAWWSDEEGVLDRENNLIPRCHAQKLDDGTWVVDDEATVTHDGRWLATEDTVQVDGDYYAYDDPLVTDHPERGWILTSTIQNDLFAEAT